MTVADWRDTRFKAVYPGFDCDVLDDNGSIVHGATKLSSVRETYQSS